MSEVSIEEILNNPKARKLVEDAWWKMYSSERKGNNFLTVSQARECADIDLAAALEMTLDKIEEMRSAGLSINTVLNFC